MSSCDISISVSEIRAEYGVNAKIDVDIKSVEIDDVINEISVFQILDHVDNDEIVQYMADEGYTLTKD